MSLVLIGSVSNISAVANSAKKSPYVDLHSKRGNILSLNKQDIKALQNGAGNGYAIVAELNHYPGPIHVLELKQKIGLTNKQEQQTNSIYQAMLKQAKHYGKLIIENEIKLNQYFKNQAYNNKNAAELQQLLLKIGKIKANLRFTHLAAHIKMKQILNAKQIKLYDKFRGYGKSGSVKEHHNHNHKHHGGHK